MKRTRTFFLVMAVVWTVIGLAAIYVASKSDMGGGTRFLMVVLAFAAIAGNWLRWYRSR